MSAHELDISLGRPPGKRERVLGLTQGSRGMVAVFATCGDKLASQFHLPDVQGCENEMLGCYYNICYKYASFACLDSADFRNVTARSFLRNSSNPGPFQSKLLKNFMLRQKFSTLDVSSWKYPSTTHSTSFIGETCCRLRYHKNQRTYVLLISLEMGHLNTIIFLNYCKKTYLLKLCSVSTLTTCFLIHCGKQYLDNSLHWNLCKLAIFDENFPQIFE